MNLTNVIGKSKENMNLIIFGSTLAIMGGAFLYNLFSSPKQNPQEAQHSTDL